MISFVVPNQKQLTERASRSGITSSWEEICNDPAMEKEVLEAIREAAASSKTFLVKKLRKKKEKE